jgi:DNA-binding CsgD family transcriptional regulator
MACGPEVARPTIPYTAAAPMIRTILIYGLLLAAAAVFLQWLEYQYLVRTHATHTYVVLVALAFLGLGVWAGARLFRRPAPPTFTPNTLAQQSLKISERELEVLQRLAAGQSNKQIAQDLDVSPNTVKTHVANLFQKLEVSRRTEAIRRARELGILS